LGLEKELSIYERELPNLIADEGKFVLIGDDKVIDVYSSYDDALKSGYKEFGLTKPFLVKQIQSIQQVHYFTRDLAIPCPT
jgi:hypothetical protein